MKRFPFARFRRPASIEALYGAIVAQARAPVFYARYGVPDTVSGRFDMIVLHLVLFLDRLGPEPAAVRGLGQRVFDRFCQDMDDQMRESGIGDLAVPKKMRGVAEAFYGRREAYSSALAAQDPGALREAVLRNVYASAEAPLGAERLATYIREAVRGLAAQDAADFARSQLVWPDPEAVALLR